MYFAKPCRKETWNGKPRYMNIYLHFCPESSVLENDLV